MVPEEGVDAVRYEAGEAVTRSFVADELVGSVTKSMEFGVGGEGFEDSDDVGDHEDVHEVVFFLGILELSEVEEIFWRFLGFSVGFGEEEERVFSDPVVNDKVV